MGSRRDAEPQSNTKKTLEENLGLRTDLDSVIMRVSGPWGRHRVSGSSRQLLDGCDARGNREGAGVADHPVIRGDCVHRRGL